MSSKSLVFFTILFLLPLIVISKYNQPSHDDFITADFVMSHGRWGTVTYFYQHVSGRYFSILLTSLLTSLPQNSMLSFKVFPIFIMLAVYLSFIFFVKAALSKFLRRDLILKIATVAFLLYVASMRSLFEGIYWMASSAGYQVALCFLLIGSGCLIHSYLHGVKTLSIVVSAIVSFLISGTSESFTIPYLCIQFAYLFWHFSRHKKFNTLNLVSIFFCIAGLAAVLASPGNWHRLAINEGARPALLYMPWRSVLAIGYYSVKWYSSIAFLGSLMLFFYFYKRNEQFFQRVMQSLLSLPFFIWLLLMGVLCITFYLPYLFLERPVPTMRLTNIQFIFVTTSVLFVFSFLLYRYKENSFLKKISIGSVYLKLSWGIFFVGLFTSSNFLLVAKELYNNTAYNFDKKNNERYQMLRLCKSDTCHVPLISNYSAVLADVQETVSPESFTPYDLLWHKAVIISER